MKNYYQLKKGGWTMEPVVYAKTVKLIQCYRLFEQIVAASGDSNRALAQRYLQVIDLALHRYVPEQYRAAVFSHLTDRTTYAALEKQFFLSASSMKRYVQIFVWGVAEELGENFRLPPGSGRSGDAGR